MRIVTLVENTACSDALIPQHGLSLYLETGDKKILFDMGQDYTFLKNARTLGIDLSQVDMAVLSHGHYDHGGGLNAFLEINQKAPVYVHSDAFGLHYNGSNKYIGLDGALLENPRLIFTKGTAFLAPDILLKDCNELGWNVSSWGLTRKNGEAFQEDAFFHEQYLYITEGEKRVLVSGCSHKGIVNLATYFHPHVLIGGFHLNKLENRKALLKIADTLCGENTLYYTGHCTGEAQFAILQEIMGDRLEKISTGKIIEL